MMVMLIDEFYTFRIVRLRIYTRGKFANEEQASTLLSHSSMSVTGELLESNRYDCFGPAKQRTSRALGILSARVPV